jgi:hypothetical protein
MIKFIKLPVIEVVFSKEKLAQIFSEEDKSDIYENGIEYNWDAMGLPPVNNNSKRNEIEFVEPSSDDFVRKVRRMRLDMIDEYADSVKMDNEQVTMVKYGSNVCFVPMTSDELDKFLQDENNYIVL